jgi:uncharacterized protein YuzE
MRIKYDKSVDAAYIYLAEDSVTQVDRTYSCDPQEVGGIVAFDFDSEGRILGIEILDASSLLLPELLRLAP